MSKNGPALQYTYKIKDMSHFLDDLEQFEISMSNFYLKFHRKTIKKLEGEMNRKGEKIKSLENYTRLMYGLIIGDNKKNSSLEGKQGEMARLLVKLKESRNMRAGVSLDLNNHKKNVVKGKGGKLEMLKGVNDENYRLTSKMEKKFVEINEF